MTTQTTLDEISTDLRTDGGVQTRPQTGYEDCLDASDAPETYAVDTDDYHSDLTLRHRETGLELRVVRVAPQTARPLDGRESLATDVVVEAVDPLGAPMERVSERCGTTTQAIGRAVRFAREYPAGDYEVSV
jgi:hypothetical protein